jgi:hypothetical protein
MGNSKVNMACAIQIWRPQGRDTSKVVISLGMVGFLASVLGNYLLAFGASPEVAGWYCFLVGNAAWCLFGIRHRHWSLALQSLTFAPGTIIGIIRASS